MWESYDAAQGWIVVTLVGIAIGFNAALLSIITEWLSDIKLGYCSTGFYLNENFCCWGEDSGKFGVLDLGFHKLTLSGCAEWKRWSGFEPFNYIVYILFAVSATKHKP